MKILTPERLRELGGEIQEIGDHGPLTPPKDCNCFEKWALPYEGRTFSLIFDRHTKLWRINGAPSIPFMSEERMVRILDLMNIKPGDQL